MTVRSSLLCCFFFFNDTATTEIYTLSLHDALPMLRPSPRRTTKPGGAPIRASFRRSEEHTSELQSRPHLVCRLLLEKKKTTSNATAARQITKKNMGSAQLG